MPTDESEAISEPNGPVFWGPRPQVAALVAFHLALTCPAAYLSLRLESLSLRDGMLSSSAPFLIAALYGFQIGQLALLVSWGAFAGQAWFLRLSRSLMLLVWTLLLSCLGESLLTGGFSTPSLIEEQSAFAFFLMFLPAVLLCSYGICLRRRFLFGSSAPVERPWQFSTRRLMLITAELALLLALARIVLNNRFSITDFWAALHFSKYQIQELIPALVSVTILPVVLAGLAKRRPWHRYALLGLYLLSGSFLLAWAQLSHLSNTYGLNNSLYWWPEFGRMFGEYVLTHLSASATILFTFYLLRRIGYDFRRRDELPLADGRNSSNARSSAASASA